MSASRKSLDGLAIGLLVLLCACWGLQQPAIKIASTSLHPVMQLGFRSLIASALLLCLMYWRREPVLLLGGRLAAGIGVGVLFALEFLFIAIGLTYTTASHMVVFVYTAPIFTALGLHWSIPDERLAIGQWLGVLLAFGGIAIAFFTGYGQSAGFTSSLIGDSMGVLAGLLWAATTILIRKSSLSEAPATQTLLYQLIGSTILLLTAGIAMGHGHGIVMSQSAWVSLAFQGIVVGFASLLGWFWLLRHYLASRLSAFSFLTPLFGVAFGVALLQDPLTPYFVVGAILVSTGIVLVALR